MEENTLSQVVETKKNPTLNIVMAVFSSLISLFLAFISFYLVSLNNYWFITLGIYSALEAGLIIAPLFIKDDYQAMRFQGISQIISVIFLMVYLLLMILWNDANGTMEYSLFIYLSLGLSCFIKALIYVFSRLLINKEYRPLLHAYGNNALITALAGLLIIELIITNQFYPGHSVTLFDNLLKEKPIWIYIIDILSNAVITILTALLALSTVIRAKTKEELTTKGKIKHTIKWFNDHEISMFFGLIFTLYLAVLALINMKQSFFYILLFSYYIGTAFIRFLNYYWHKKIQKQCGDNLIKENRKSSWILLFDSFAYLVFSNVLVLGAIFMMIQKANTDTNIYLFLFMIVPMAFVRFLLANKNVRRNRRENNTYRLGISLISLVSLFFSILEIVAITMHEVPIVWLRYVFIILAIIIAKIAVIVVAIIFVIHWIRSMILNRKSKERKLRNEKEGL